MNGRLFCLESRALFANLLQTAWLCLECVTESSGPHCFILWVTHYKTGDSITPAPSSLPFLQGEMRVVVVFFPPLNGKEIKERKKNLQQRYFGKKQEQLTVFKRSVYLHEWHPNERQVIHSTQKCGAIHYSIGITGLEGISRVIIYIPALTEHCSVMYFWSEESIRDL